MVGFVTARSVKSKDTPPVWIHLWIAQCPLKVWGSKMVKTCKDPVALQSTLLIPCWSQQPAFHACTFIPAFRQRSLWKLDAAELRKSFLGSGLGGGFFLPRLGARDKHIKRKDTAGTWWSESLFCTIFVWSFDQDLDLSQIPFRWPNLFCWQKATHDLCRGYRYRYPHISHSLAFQDAMRIQKANKSGEEKMLGLWNILNVWNTINQKPAASCIMIHAVI